MLRKLKLWFVPALLGLLHCFATNVENRTARPAPAPELNQFGEPPSGNNPSIPSPGGSGGGSGGGPSVATPAPSAPVVLPTARPPSTGVTPAVTLAATAIATPGTTTIPPPAPVVIGNVPLGANPNFPLGLPMATRARNEVVISRKQYALAWNRDTRNVSWASWTVETRDLGTVGRRDEFQTDLDLQGYLVGFGKRAVDPFDYSGSCLDRGHQVPSGDRTATVADNTATFLMSNVIPQTAFVNRGAWERLESHVRYLVKSHTSTKYLVTAGGVYDSDPPHIGPRRDIAVPNAVFKVVVALPNGRVASSAPVGSLMAVIVPNVTSTGGAPIADRAQACADAAVTTFDSRPGFPDDWKAFVVSLGEVERRTGTTLFPNLDRATHDRWSAFGAQVF